MFCANCGAEIKNNSKFCNKCGYQIDYDALDDNENFDDDLDDYSEYDDDSDDYFPVPEITKKRLRRPAPQARPNLVKRYDNRLDYNRIPARKKKHKPLSPAVYIGIGVIATAIIVGIGILCFLFFRKEEEPDLKDNLDSNIQNTVSTMDSDISNSNDNLFIPDSTNIDISQNETNKQSDILCDTDTEDITYEDDSSMVNGVNYDGDDFVLTCSKVKLDMDNNNEPVASIFFDFENKTDTPYSEYSGAV